LISKILVGRKTSKVVENADETSFGERQFLDGALLALADNSGRVQNTQAPVFGRPSANIFSVSRQRLHMDIVFNQREPNCQSPGALEGLEADGDLSYERYRRRYRYGQSDNGR
jgi:hypothetical protein